MGDPNRRGGQIVLKDCKRHGRKYTGTMCQQCIPSCSGGDSMYKRVPHTWKKAGHKNQKLKCTGCRAIVVVRGRLFDIRRLPRGLVSEKLKDCCPCSMHDLWDVWDNEDSSFTIRCWHCDLRIKIDGFGFEITGGWKHE